MGFATYMRGVDQAVEHTPPERNRAADAWRVIALLVVVIGHWLAASVWVQADGNVLVLYYAGTEQQMDIRYAVLAA